MRDNRQFAVDLMHRAGLSFDVSDVGLACSVIEQLELEISDWLEAEMRGVVVVTELIAKLRGGTWKPDRP